MKKLLGANLVRRVKKNVFPDFFSHFQKTTWKKASNTEKVSFSYQMIFSPGAIKERMLFFVMIRTQSLMVFAALEGSLKSRDLMSPW